MMLLAGSEWQQRCGVKGSRKVQHLFIGIGGRRCRGRRSVALNKPRFLKRLEPSQRLHLHTLSPLSQLFWASPGTTARTIPRQELTHDLFDSLIKQSNLQHIPVVLRYAAESSNQQLQLASQLETTHSHHEDSCTATPACLLYYCHRHLCSGHPSPFI